MICFKTVLVKVQETEVIPAGLVRLREEGSLKMRGGVNIALARRLNAGINGSFTVRLFIFSPIRHIITEI